MFYGPSVVIHLGCFCPFDTGRVGKVRMSHVNMDSEDDLNTFRDPVPQKSCTDTPVGAERTSKILPIVQTSTSILTSRVYRMIMFMF